MADIEHRQIIVNLLSISGYLALNASAAYKLDRRRMRAVWNPNAP